MRILHQSIMQQRHGVEYCQVPVKEPCRYRRGACRDMACGEYGVPELLSAYGKLIFKVTLTELAELNLENAMVSEADYLIMRQGVMGPERE